MKRHPPEHITRAAGGSYLVESPFPCRVNRAPRLFTEVIEPYHGRKPDPACGSGSMFVSSARFVFEHKASPLSTQAVGHLSPSGRRDGDEGFAAYYSGNPSRQLFIHGVEKTYEIGRLCRLNLAVLGLEGKIKHGANTNRYYYDPHNATGRFDFVLANQPFNVNALDTAMRVSAQRHSEGTQQDLSARQDHERLKEMVRPGRRFRFGLPRTGNANYPWIQLFYSALTEDDCAGFVMANNTRSRHSCSIKVTEDVQKHVAEQVVKSDNRMPQS